MERLFLFRGEGEDDGFSGQDGFIHVQGLASLSFHGMPGSILYEMMAIIPYKMPDLK
jgi:hypothetical protein